LTSLNSCVILVLNQTQIHYGTLADELIQNNMQEKRQIQKTMGFSKLFILILIVNCSLLIGNSLFSQSITWEKIYNGPGNNSDGFRSSCQADGDNMYAVGYTFRTGNLSSKSVFVVKMNKYGDTIWTRVFGDSLRRPDALAVTSSGDGGCVLTGGWWEAYTMKLSSSGEVNWQKFYGGTTVQLYDIKKTPDGGYIACGRYDDANFNGYILKIDSAGNLQWQRMYPAKFFRVFYSVEIAHDSGYVLVGYFRNFTGEKNRGFITKINTFGDTLWNKSFSIDTNTAATKIVKITNGYIIGGNILWPTFPTYTAMYFYRVDINGDSLYAKIFYGTKKEGFNDLKVINSNKFILSGYQDSAVTPSIHNGKIWITDSTGMILKQKTLPSPDYIELFSILPLTNGDIVIAGEADMNMNPFNDAYAVRLDSNLNYVPIGINNISNILPNKMMLYPNYPNPFNPVTTIKYDIPGNNTVTVKVYDLLGREVFSSTEYKTVGSYEVRFDGTNLASGLYFYSLEAGNFRDVKKMVLVK
jgi:hypothetical protein